MSFYLYDIIFLIIFGVFLAIFLIKRRKKLQREGVLILYRTKLGIKVINYISKKYKKLLNSLGVIIIFSGYVLMVGMLYLLFNLLYIFLKFPEIIKAIKVPPLMPLIPYLPNIFKIDFLPPFFFTYWIIVLAIAAISHEFFHGIFAKAKNIEIKSTGFAFLGPFLAAFVEPDEKKVRKLKPKDQLAFLSAGTFANIIMTAIFFFILLVFFFLAFTPSGVIFNSYTSNTINVSDIELVGENIFSGSLNMSLTKVQVEGKWYYINSEDFEKGKIIAYEDAPALKAGLAGTIIEFNGEKIRTYKDLERELEERNPGEVIKVKTLQKEQVREYEIRLGEHPDNENRAYLGIALIGGKGVTIFSRIRNSLSSFKNPNTYYKPKFNGDFIIFIYNLLLWIVLINFSVALVNMLPLGIFDGGRVFFLTILMLTKSEKTAKRAYNISTYLLLLVFFMLMLQWFISFVLG